MKITTKAVLLLVLTPLFLANPTEAAETGEASDDSAALLTEMKTLNKSLREMSELLKGYLDNQRFEVLMKRVEFKAKALVDAEKSLENMKQDRESSSTQIIELESNLKQLDLETQLAQERGEPSVEERIEQIQEQVQAKLKNIKQRIGDLDLRIMEMENKIQDRREEIEGWEEFLDHELEMN